VRVYVASSWRNDRQPAVVCDLRQEGHEVYDFRHPGGNHPDGFHWSEIDPAWRSWTPSQFREGLNHPIAQEGLAVDYRALRWCDAVVLVLPSGRSSHLELGYVIGAGKQSIILLSDGEPELMYGLAGSVCTDIAEVVGVLAAHDRDRRR
jgi:hypothetical protein